MAVAERLRAMSTLQHVQRPLLIAFAFKVLAAFARIPQVGFSNPYYQALGYEGSRVLEHNQTGRFSEYMEVTWTQSMCVGHDGRVWVVDKIRNQVLTMPASSRYVGWPALYEEYAGTKDVAGHLDGMRRQALFDGPSGLVLSDATQSLLIYVADTNNHCVRRLDFATGRTATLAGSPLQPGLRDGPAMQSRFRFPVSLGIDALGENLFVLDDIRRIRWVSLGATATAGEAYVTTLVDGACRSSYTRMVAETVVLRTVGCHTDWRARDTGDTEVELFQQESVCVGHYSSCGPRNHPALSDERSENLMLRSPGTATSSVGPPSPPVSRRLVNTLPPKRRLPP
mmetsp:Transcript_63225/g.150798  ORF Transcript_63225/g.150798 Transcript_63225/m.150798 type:complete len:340 (+) Transcript_63225:85-1104(+)